MFCLAEIRHNFFPFSRQNFIYRNIEKRKEDKEEKKQPNTIEKNNSNISHQEQ